MLTVLISIQITGQIAHVILAERFHVTHRAMLAIPVGVRSYRTTIQEPS